MVHDEKARMIHIRLDGEVHRDLRRAAAEEDTSLQELVARVVSRSVDGGRLLDVTCSADAPPGSAHIVSLSLEEDGLHEPTVGERLDRLEGLLDLLMREVRMLRDLVGETTSGDPV